MRKKILITGAAGFIGSSLIDRLISDDGVEKIIGVDNFDPFYSRQIKESNIIAHTKKTKFNLIEQDINDFEELRNKLEKEEINTIVHLAAKAGVRPSIQDPQGYFKTNVTGTLNLLEIAKEKNIKKFVFASSSSVYGKNPQVPWQESDLNLEPISPYAASKIAAEKVCQTYAHLYDLDIIGLRFFTVYGPKQRPDLAIHKFFKLGNENKPIPFFGDGSTRRDYTFIEDIVDGIIGAINTENRNSRFRVYNLGNHNTVSLNELVIAIGKTMGRPLVLDRKPMQAGDVKQTYASIDKAINDLSYLPKTNLEDGLDTFYDWFKKRQDD